MARRIQATKRGFTLVEMTIVVGILAMILAIAVPTFLRAVTRAKENRIRADLSAIRSAMKQFYLDTSGYPTSLNQLSTFPSGPTLPGTYSASPVTLVSADWRGPYLTVIPTDPIAKTPYTYNSSAFPPTVSATAAGTDQLGVAFSAY